MEINYIFITEHKENTKVVPHFHQFYEFVFYLHGEGICNYEESHKNTSVSSKNKNIMTIEHNKLTKVEHFNTNKFIIFPENVVHNEIHYTDCRMLCIGFTLSSEEKNVYKLYNTFSLNNDIISKYAKKIEIEFKEKNLAFEKVIYSLFEIILTMIQRNVNASNVINSSLNYARTYIDEYYMNNINMSELAKQVGYSLDHFIVRFKQEYNITPKQYILQKRIEVSKELLKETTLPLSIISERVGFNTYSQFVSIFKKTTSFSPLQYRQSHYLD